MPGQPASMPAGALGALLAVGSTPSGKNVWAVGTPAVPAAALSSPNAAAGVSLGASAAAATILARDAAPSRPRLMLRRLRTLPSPHRRRGRRHRLASARQAHG